MMAGDVNFLRRAEESESQAAGSLASLDQSNLGSRPLAQDCRERSLKVQAISTLLKKGSLSLLEVNHTQDESQTLTEGLLANGYLLRSVRRHSSSGPQAGPFEQIENEIRSVGSLNSLRSVERFSVVSIVLDVQPIYDCAFVGAGCSLVEAGGVIALSFRGRGDHVLGQPSQLSQLIDKVLEAVRATRRFEECNILDVGPSSRGESASGFTNFVVMAFRCSSPEATTSQNTFLETDCSVLFIGPPAAGKTTQACMLSARSRKPAISHGQIIRELMAKDPVAHEKFQAAMNNGEGVPIEISMQALVTRLSNRDCERGVILDSAVRSTTHIESIERAFQICSLSSPLIVELDARDEIIAERVRQRARASGDSARIDDCPTSFLKRAQSFRACSETLRIEVGSRGLISWIDGNSNAMAVHNNLCLQLGIEPFEMEVQAQLT